MIVSNYYIGGLNYMQDQSKVEMLSFGNLGFSTALCMKDVITDLEDKTSVGLYT